MSNPRAEFSPIFSRKPLHLPGDSRVALWVIINLEEWDINEAMARTVLPAPQGREVIPDIPNFRWFDYGLRVGFWRLKRVLDRRGIRGDDKPERIGLPLVSPDRESLPRFGLGVDGPRFHPESHQRRAGRTRGYPTLHQHDSGVQWSSASGLDGAGSGRDF